MTRYNKVGKSLNYWKKIEDLKNSLGNAGLGRGSQKFLSFVEILETSIIFPFLPPLLSSHPRVPHFLLGFLVSRLNISNIQDEYADMYNIVAQFKADQRLLYFTS